MAATIARLRVQPDEMTHDDSGALGLRRVALELQFERASRRGDESADSKRGDDGRVV
jgi:hypothetical protein